MTYPSIPLALWDWPSEHDSNRNTTLSFYGTSESSLQEITTEDNGTTTIIIHITTGGKYTIGVAAVNSAGQSPITYSSEGVGK